MPEYDHAGNPCCGEDFMGGTICSLPPNHGGAHGTICQECGQDWFSGACACPYCECCERHVPTPFHHDDHNPPYDGYDYCRDCYDQGCDGPTGNFGCSLPDKFFDVVPKTSEPTDDDMAYVLNSLGITPEEGGQ